MIARLWKGYTKNEDACAYGELLLTSILPGFHRIEGYRGAHVLRRPLGNEIEFTVITYWGSMDAIHAFAGEHGEGAVIPPEAQALLCRYDDHAQHHDVVFSP